MLIKNKLPLSLFPIIITRADEGTWQQYLLDLHSEKEPYLGFDAAYFDTYSEHYADLHSFFSSLPNLLLSPTSLFSFFHGLGATSRLFYDVYTEVSQLHLEVRSLSLLSVPFSLLIDGRSFCCVCVCYS